MFDLRPEGHSRVVSKSNLESCGGAIHHFAVSVSLLIFKRIEKEKKKTGDPSQAERQTDLARDLVLLVLGLGLGLLQDEDCHKDVDDDDAEENPVVVLAGVLLVQDRASDDLRVDSQRKTRQERQHLHEAIECALALRGKKKILDPRRRRRRRRRRHGAGCQLQPTTRHACTRRILVSGAHGGVVLV
jgi:hypothetical protein